MLGSKPAPFHRLGGGRVQTEDGKRTPKDARGGLSARRADVDLLLEVHLGDRERSQSDTSYILR